MINIEYKNIDFDSSNHQNALARATKCSFQIKELIKQKAPKYEIFCIDSALKQINSFQKYVIEIKNNYSDVIVIGMGGAILNPKTLINLCQKNNSSNLKIHFIDNTDPSSLQQLLLNINLKTCAILAISNSGNTLETNSLIGVLLAYFNKNNIDIHNRFYFITNPKEGMLCRIGTEVGATIIAHTDDISGRFSGLTNVSTFIASLIDIDVKEYIAGADKKLQEFLNNNFDSAARSAAVIYGEQKPIMINLGYLQRFQSYLEWYSQIIAESLGKNNAGITPLYGLGPNDQHSMLQLYIDGPDDKFYSFFYVEKLESNLAVSALPVFENLANKNLSEINSVNFQATSDSLNLLQKPMRIVTLQNFSSKIIGELVVHSMLETIILAHMMNLNPFDQPGVQLIKSNSNIIINK